MGLFHYKSYFSRRNEFYLFLSIYFYFGVILKTIPVIPNCSVPSRTFVSDAFANANFNRFLTPDMASKKDARHGIRGDISDFSDLGHL